VGRHHTRVEEVIALVSDHSVARAAFVEAVRRRPGKIITLRQKSRVLADSRGWGLCSTTAQPWNADCVDA